jgi:hypothetical protein
MSWRILLLSGAGVLAALTAVVLLSPRLFPNPPASAVLESTPRLAPRRLAAPLAAGESAGRPFWEAANVAEPSHPRLPMPAKIPPHTAPLTGDTAAAVRQLETASRTPENIRRLNDKAVVWFAQSPGEAAAWLNQTSRFPDLEMAVASIASAIAEQGHLDTALDWLDTVGDADIRQRTMISIYNLEARRGRVTREELEAAGLTPGEIERIFQSD